MKNVGIYYTGGCGGHFMWYLLAASGKYEAWNGACKIDLGKNKNIKKLRQQFYFQFDANYKWLEHEIKPINKTTSTHNQLFHFLHPEVQENVNEVHNAEMNLDCIKICPYINNIKDWVRTMLYKRTNMFYNQNITVNLVKDLYNEILQRNTELKIPGCDYYVDIMKFVHDKKERDKLCNFLHIKNNDMMEEFIDHYVPLHRSLEKTNWVIDNLSKYVL